MEHHSNRDGIIHWKKVQLVSISVSYTPTLILTTYTNAAAHLHTYNILILRGMHTSPTTTWAHY